ncbi:MAG: SIR2 family protein [Pirellulales bacterium]
MIDWPRELIEDIARRRCVLFLGSGVSKNSLSHDSTLRPPDWLEFLSDGLAQCDNPRKHIKRLLREQDYLTACEIIKDKMGERWHRYVNDRFVQPRFQPADIHRDIFRLDCRVVLTQNVDKVYDTFALAESHNTVYVKQYFDTDVARVVRGDRRCVLKAHGSVDSVTKMVFTRKDYSDARYQFPRFYALLDALVLTHTFLFLGCGLSDPDVRLMLERHAQVFPDSRPHVMVMSSKAVHAEVRECFFRNLNLQFLTYKPDDHHRELQASVKELVTLTEEVRRGLAATLDW